MCSGGELEHYSVFQTWYTVMPVFFITHSLLHHRHRALTGRTDRPDRQTVRKYRPRGHICENESLCLSAAVWNFYFLFFALFCFIFHFITCFAACMRLLPSYHPTKSAIIISLWPFTNLRWHYDYLPLPSSWLSILINPTASPRLF